MSNGNKASTGRAVAPASRSRSSARGSTRPRSRRVELANAVSVAQLAELLGLSSIEVIKQFMRNGVMAAINQVVDFETAAVVCQDFGFEPVRLQAPEQEGVRAVQVPAPQEEEDASQLVPRSPVVTILGHVDHGKTTLLDAIRESNVAGREAGGITQHIGAYQVEYQGQKIAFIDTPGHEAFTAMRARGAQVTDIAVLVVAADDGVMPQTIEAIHHAKAAQVPIVVAINKVDKAGVDVDRVKRQLSEQGLLIEEWGGDVIAVPVSAKQRMGIDELLQNILVVAEVSELKANPNRPARGVVIEAKLTTGRGAVATVLVQTGTLRQGDYVVVGESRGRIKAMFTELGKRVKSAGPSTPVEVLGLADLPLAGDTLEVVESEQAARTLVEERQRRRQEERLTQAARLEEVYAKIRSGEVHELNLIIKTDVQGTIDAVTASLEQLGTDKVRVNLVHASSGSITEGDVLLALASKANIISFGARLEPGARRVAEQEGVEVRYYDVIYRLIEDVQQVLEGMGLPTVQEVTDGRAEVRAVFSLSRRGKVAGIYVREGKVQRNAFARVLRKEKVIHDGPIRSLKHFKNDVRELTTGLEGGLSLEAFDDFQEGDILEIHHQEQVAR